MSTKREEALPAQEDETESDGILISEVQLILAEKRTSLASLRTGIAVFALPLSVLSALIATSKYYDVANVLPLLLPLLLLCAVLTVLGIYLITRSLIKIRHHDRMIMDIKRHHSKLAPFID